MSAPEELHNTSPGNSNNPAGDGTDRTSGGSTSGDSSGGTNDSGTTNGSTSGGGTGSSGGTIGDNGSGTGDTTAPQAALASFDVDAGLSGVQASADVLGKDVADVSIGLGALDSVLGLVDGLTCSESGGSSMSSVPNAPLLSAAVNADLSGVQAAVDVLGHDTVDASIGLGALDSVLGLVDAKTCLVDSASGLADGLLCDIV